MTAISRATLDTMLHAGGDFEQALARCIIEADTWIGYTCSLIKAYNCADPANKGMIEVAFQDLWALENTVESERIGFLHDLFGDIFDRFEAVAQRQQGAKA